MEKITELKKITEKERPKDFLSKPKCEFCNQEFPLARYSEIFNVWHHDGCNCEEAEAIKEKRKREAWLLEIKKNKDQYLLEAGITKRYENKFFENFDVRTNIKNNILTACEKFVSDFTEQNDVKGLIFTGKPGTGKTHLCAAIIHALFDSDLVKYHNKIKMINMISMLNEIKESYDNKGLSENTIINNFINKDLLIIDDFGKEYSKNQGFGNSWADEKLYKIINGRYENLKTIIITTNFTISELEKKTDPAIISRLMEICVGLKCEWEDFRKTFTKII